MWIIGQIGLFNLGMATGPGEIKLWIQIYYTGMAGNYFWILMSEKLHTWIHMQSWLNPHWVNAVTYTHSFNWRIDYLFWGHQCFSCLKIIFLLIINKPWKEQRKCFCIKSLAYMSIYVSTEDENVVFGNVLVKER